MHKHRILALLLSVMLTVSYTLGRSQTARAATALTAQQIDILYGLLASGGVIAAHEGTNAKKRQTIQDWWTTAPDVPVGGLEGWTADTDGNYKYDVTANPAYGTATAIKDWLANLRTSFVDWINSAGLSFSISPPTAWDYYTDSYKYTSKTYVPTTVGSGECYVLFARYLPDRGLWNSSLCGVMSDGTFIHYQLRDNYGATAIKALSYNGKHYDGAVTAAVYGYVSTVKDTPSTKFSSFGVRLLCDGDVIPYGDAGISNDDYTDDSFALVVFGSGVARPIGAGNADVSSLVLDVANVLGQVDTGIDCDTWSDTLSRDMVDDNKDVVILGGQDLSGYDTVDSVRAGYVSGVDWDNTSNPDVPVPGDIPGKLDSIIDWLKGLPALLGTALIGDGKIDWSKLQGIEIKSVFPFCIPWDLAACFKSFNVDAIEPVFVFDFADTPLKSAGTVQLDLHRFSEIIPIVRYFVYGFFVVGLIVKTRDLIRG